MKHGSGSQANDGDQSGVENQPRKMRKINSRTLASPVPRLDDVKLRRLD